MRQELNIQRGGPQSTPANSPGVKTFRLRLLICSLLLLVTCENLYAQKDDGSRPSSAGTNVGTTTAAAFLEIGAGAAAQAMGGAFVALARDATAMYWNPAGIGNISGYETTFSHINWLVDTNYDYFGIVSPIGKGATVGVNVTVFGTGDQPVRRVGQEEGTGELYSAQDIAAGVTLALKLTDRFSFGVNAKYIQQRIWNSSASGFAIDVGGLYETQFDGLQMGFSISNFGSDMRMKGRDLQNVIDPDILNEGVDNIAVSYDTDAFTLPLLFRFGISYQLQVFDRTDLTVAVDLLHANNDEESVNVGAELLLIDIFSLRAGYRSLFLTDSIGGLSLGAGLLIPTRSDLKISFDYAYVDWGILNAANMISVGLMF
ncbi:MAG: PorV/PorQ family protein [Bacteroidetes bacterium]|nr:MAG: PorV/PorQ family protein [Bacteroidota bacterium]